MIHSPNAQATERSINVQKNDYDYRIHYIDFGRARKNKNLRHTDRSKKWTFLNHTSYRLQWKHLNLAKFTNQVFL